MQDKEIRIRAVLSADDFDKGVKQIEDKLKKMQQDISRGQGTQKTLGGDTVLGKYAQQAFGDFSKESQKQLEQMYNTQRREAVSQSITLKGKQQELEKLSKIDEQMTKQQKERVELLKKEIDLLKEKQRATLDAAAQTKRAIDQIQPPGDEDPGPSPIQRFGGFLKAIGAGAIAEGALNATAIGMEDYYTRERKILGGEAAQLNVGSKELREQFEGRGSRGMFFAQERARAANLAATEESGRENIDLLRAGGSAATAGVMAYGGMKLGAGIGTAIAPGVGTVIGGGIGAIAGGVGGMLLTSNERTRARIFDQEKYRSMVGAEAAENYEQNLASIKARDPKAALAQEYFEQNRGNIAQMQRSLGMGSDEELFGDLGFLRNMIQSGQEFGGVNFSQQNIQDQLSRLAQGGATTEGMRELSGRSAAYQRQFNLGNTAEVMGQLSGAGLGAFETEDAYKKMLAEAVKMGVDTSRMPKEMERMTAMTAQLATAGGGFAEGAVQVGMAGIEGFDRTSIQAAQSAAEMFKQSAKAGGGFEGQMGFGYLQSQEAEGMLGRKLDSKEMNFLNQFSFTEARQEDFQRIADYLGTDQETAKNLLRQKDLYKQTRTSEEQSAAETLGQFLQEQGQLTPDQLRQTISQGEGAKLFTNLQSEMTASRGEGFSGLNQAQQRARALSLARLNTPGLDIPGLDAEEQVESTLRRQEGRAAFVEEGAEGTGDLARISALNENIDRLRNAARAHSEQAELYNKQFDLFIDALKSGTSSMEQLAGQLDDVVKDLADKGYVTAKPGE